MIIYPASNGTAEFESRKQWRKHKPVRDQNNAIMAMCEEEGCDMYVVEIDLENPVWKCTGHRE